MGEESIKETSASEDKSEANQSKYCPENFKVKVDHFDGIHCLGKKHQGYANIKHQSTKGDISNLLLIKEMKHDWLEHQTLDK